MTTPQPSSVSAPPAPGAVPPAPPAPDTLSPTARTTPTRGRNRQVDDRRRLMALLDDALIAHLGVVAGAHLVVLPTAFGVDPAGPDDGGTLYLHGSVAAGWLAPALEHDVCVTVTELEGLVLARTGFHHSMNYRSAVVIGRPRRVTDQGERRRALDLIVDHMVPGRSATLRPPTRRELAATVVIALPLAEASMKQREGGATLEPGDLELDGWAGLVPVRRVASAPVTEDYVTDEVPELVLRRAAELGRV
ncbi:pyridoxamine 5'-phosphate oxidase family protein [Promicromonospora kroppenstedtii]|uniref:pyridoxamine 5'-phosphate oxidase family protein n=1 Tax=Promicromonospora kroppenstedtii TaxID=440482 RepID=UPI002481270E|nr:pyridoxamine 5'-phosphate oxidase family protein [Promicromonospora kroppenstedtii]